LARYDFCLTCLGFRLFARCRFRLARFCFRFTRVGGLARCRFRLTCFGFRSFARFRFRSARFRFRFTRVCSLWRVFAFVWRVFAFVSPAFAPFGSFSLSFQLGSAGAVHPLTAHVMGYIKHLLEIKGDCLCTLFGDEGASDSTDVNAQAQADTEAFSRNEVRRILMALETNLEAKADKAYKGTGVCTNVGECHHTSGTP
jgi:hypothetical protein